MIEQQTMEENQTAFKKRSGIDTKTMVIGGGILAGILFLILRKSGGVKPDKTPVTFNLRKDGLYLAGKRISVTDAIARVLSGGRRDALITVAGDTRQGDVDAVDVAFQNAGIALSTKQPQSFASVYQRGLGGNIA